MSSILDNAVLIGKESTYGTAASLTRAYEAKADTWKRSQDYLDSVGMRSGMHTVRSDRVRAVNMGGEGTIEADVLTNGFGLLLQACLGTVTGPTVVVSPAYKSTHATDAADPNDSFTVQVLRTDVTGTQQAFTHTGAVVTKWSLKQEVGGLLGMTFDFDFRDVATNIAAGTPTYVAGDPYDWTQCAATWNGSGVCLTSFSLEGDLGLDTDRRCMSGSALKKQPIRSKLPEFTGQAEMEFSSLDQYNAFIAGTTAPLIVTWTGAIISGANAYTVTLTLPKVMFTGESPEVALDNLPKQNVPFRVLHDGTNPAVKIEYQSTDTAL